MTFGDFLTEHGVAFVVGICVVLYVATACVRYLIHGPESE